MRILMSIQSKYARKIFSGRKKWEFRKSVPRDAADPLFPATIVVYSAGEDRAIIGEFSVGRIVTAPFQDLMRVTGAAEDPEAVEWLSDYYGPRRLCSAIEVTHVNLYHSPISLRELKQQVPAFRPPQNFFYLGNQSAVDQVLRISVGLPA